MAASRSASAKMMFGFFPPSSSETFLKSGAPASATFRPVTVPPVKEIVPIFGCAVMAEPTFGPVPCTMLRTPFGKPASRQTSPSRKAVIGVSSLGFATAVFPTAMAGAIFQLKQIERQIPGRNEPDDPARLAQGVVEGNAIHDVRLVLGVQDRGREKPEIARGPRNIEAARERRAACRCRSIRRAQISPDRARSDRRCAEESANVPPPACATMRETLSPPRPTAIFDIAAVAVRALANMASRSRARYCRDTFRRPARRTGRR